MATEPEQQRRIEQQVEVIKRSAINGAVRYFMARFLEEGIWHMRREDIEDE